MSLMPRLPRISLIAWLVAAPAVASALLIATVEIQQGRQRATTDQLPLRPFALAICDHSVEDAYQFIRAGADPNAPIPFRHQTLTGDREVMVSPLMVAAACHEENSTIMLLGFGARMDAPTNRYALCLARQMKYEDIARLLVKDGRANPDAPCPPAAPGPPLLAYPLE